MKKLKIFNKIIATAVLSIVLCGCDSDVFNINADPFKDSNYINKLNLPISSYLTGQSDFSEYAKMLNYADMYNALNQSTTGVSFTAFVPTNDAMKDFYQRIGVDSLSELTKDYARSFVLYHTVKDSILPESFILKSYVENLNTDKIKISIDSLNAGQAWLNDQGHVVQMGLSAYNGKIYVLSKAMTPLVETVYDRLYTSSTSKIMLEAIKETGWQKELNIISDTTFNESNERVITKRYFTLFDVSDATFAKASINSLDDLKKALVSKSTQGLTDDSLLRQYVSYHIMKNAYTMDNLGTMTGSDVMRIWNTSANNQVMTVTYDSISTNVKDKYTLNAQGTSAKYIVENSDVLCKNGYLHEIDSWLPVWEPQQARVVWDLADYTDIKTLIPSEYYQPVDVTASENRYSILSAPCFTYEKGEAGSSNHSYSNIDYVTCKSNLSKAVNHDRVVFNVGYMGSVQMTTPTLVKGKYKVELSIIYLTDHSFMRQQTDGNGGLLKLSFDDNPAMTTFASPYTNVTSAFPDVYTSTIYDELEFSETASHTFKFIVLDPAASTNSRFSLQFDCIIFTPLK